MNRPATSLWSAAFPVSTGLLLTAALPLILDEFALVQLCVYAIMSILALSLAFVWGYAGILCFGQSAFFGIGAYAYAIAAINLSGTTVPALLSVVVPAIFAAGLGYVMFYGRLSEMYTGVITLTVTLILFNLMNSTSGPDWTIGTAPLGGFNGIPSIPQVHLPGRGDDVLAGRELFVAAMVSLVTVYLGLRVLAESRVGRVIAAVRENEQRAVLLGYDIRLYRLFAFVLGGAIAGFSGFLFANWSGFISPTVFSLSGSAQILIWTVVGGVGTLVGPILGCFLVQWLTSIVGSQQLFNANLALGVVLVVFVLLVPHGIVPTLGSVFESLREARQRKTESAGRPLSCIDGVANHDTDP